MNKQTPLSPARAGLFIFISFVIIPVLFFCIVELGLTVIDFGDDTRYLKKCEYDGCNHYVDNPEFTRQFFSKELARSALPVRVPYEKPDNTFRIYVLGASAAAGYPLSDFGFSRILEIMLRDAFPGVRFEVINTSNVAINSHVVLKIAEQLSGHAPDMFLMYLGNNEVVGPYGPGTVFNAFSNHLWMLRAGIFINSFRTSQLIKFVIDQFSFSKKAESRDWKGMSMFVDNQIRADDPRLVKTYEFFHRNIEDIAMIADKHGIPMVVSTVSSNLKDLAPFASEADALNKEAFEISYQRGITYEDNGDYREAVDAYLASLIHHPNFADIYFRLGRSYIELERYALAKKYFIEARDLDALRFRAVSSINDIIKDLAEDYDHVYLVDTVFEMNAASPYKISGRELFYEHVHFNFDGQYMLARLMFEEITKYLPQDIVDLKSQNAGTLSREKIARQLGFTEYEELLAVNHLLDRLVDGAPFINILNYDVLIDTLTQRQQELDQYINENGYEDIFDRQVDAFNEDPSDPWRHYHLGRLLIQMGRPHRAVEFLQFAVRELPSLKDAHNMLDLAYERIQENN